ncbi:hypothetical protein [Lignipirellula cremea]|uniref:Uncharacterized protein n=1 Tax=Lignipirellula cremea TaxID=2528010 RepID=A0A518DT70_9BACT|nr:hypothetical protein [Lignipirellula cremea]QDU95037.1 hypothetical protein Pla8534_28480 [Lignipirellula cremea]
MLRTFPRRTVLAAVFSSFLWCAPGMCQDAAPAPPTLDPIVSDSDGSLEVGNSSAAPDTLEGTAASDAAPLPQMMPRPTPELFYNYYAQPWMGGVPAAMYVSPLPVPEHVGHTYYTYQPFLPHEWMYPHYRDYYNYHTMYQGNGIGYDSYNKTSISWSRGKFRPTTPRYFLNGKAPHKQYRHTGYGLPGAGGEGGYGEGAYGYSSGHAHGQAYCPPQP